MIKLNSLLLVFILSLPISLNASQFCNSTGCFDCYYRCSSCFGPYSFQCTACTQNYILNNSTCYSCTSNCLSCRSSSQNQGCQTCAMGFYLSQSTSTCSPCPQGASTCTFSAVQQCQSGYYLLNSVCFFCLSGCMSCSNAYACNQCQSGYYLTSQNTCSQCAVANCASCDSNNNCFMCNPGYYGSNCTFVCPTNCDVCDGVSCYQCAPTYTIGTSGYCQPLSILCSSSSSSSNCDQCLSDISFASEQVCSPYQYVHSWNKQDYYLPFNNPDNFTGNLSLCSERNLYYSVATKQMIVSFSIVPSYLLAIKMQILTTFTNQSVTINVFADNLVEYPVISINPKSYQTCGNQSLIITNFKANFTPKLNTSQQLYTINLSLALSSSNSIGISQLLVQQMPCRVINCAICLTAYTCQLCLQNYYLQNNLCVRQCSEGYYLNAVAQTCTLTCTDGYYPILADYQCQLCVNPCATCSSPTLCNSCVEGTYLLNSQCVISCQSGYYADAGRRVCMLCRYPCQNCMNSSSVCTSCTTGYLNGSICVISCPSGFFANITTITCQQCLSPCFQCKIINTQCTSCQIGFFLQQNSTCLNSCDTGYVAVNGTCTKCAFPCLACNNSVSNCISCQAGYLYLNSCLSTCPKGYYNDLPNRLCQICLSPCLQCSSFTVCKSCLANYNYYATNSSCLFSCPATTYSLAGICTPCKSPCNTCDEKGCLSCQGYLYVFSNQTCLLTCPITTYMTLSNTSTKICAPCGSNCTICLNSTQCLHCINNTVLLGGLCVDNCSQTYYPQDGNCLLCVSPCKNCLSVDMCLSCVEGYIFYSDTYSCLRVCPNSYYALNGSCSACDAACALCNDSSKLCLQCVSGYYKSVITNTCADTCQVGYYAYPPQRVCKKCSSPCKSCIYGSLCLGCFNDSNSAYPLLYQHSCVSVCPNGFYSANNSICLACDSNCKNCVLSATNCTSCSQPFLIVYDPTRNYCVKDCPAKYYATSLGTCTSCISPCLTCISSTYCLTCLDSSLMALNGKCTVTCGAGYYSMINNQSLVCSACSFGCLTCSKVANNCISCTKYLSNSTCTSACPDGFYGDSLSSLCLACNSPCLLCFSSSRCKSCKSGFYLYNDVCLTSCPSGFYQSDYANLCLACVPPCRSCSKNNTCLSCVTGYFFSQNNSTCLTNCAVNEYSFQTTSGDMQCLTCSNTCYQCYDATACKSCKNNSALPYLQATTCQTQCTDGYYSLPASYTCQSCGKWCLTCHSSNNCTKCSNAYLLQGICTSQCPPMYYASLVFTCQKCISPCLTCASSANCLSCVTGYYLYLTHCLLQCPIDQWAIDSLNICNSTCSYPLYYIKSNRSCSYSCELYQSLDRVCLPVCESGYMANTIFACQSCQTMDCSRMLYFEMKQLQMDGKLKIQLVFNYPLDNLSVTTRDLALSLQTSNSPTSQETDISALRSLQEMTSPIINIVSVTPNIITIQVQLDASDAVFSGNAKLRIVNLAAFTSKGFPVQSPEYTLSIEWFQQDSDQKWVEAIAYIISFVYLFCFLVNFAFNNIKVLVPLADIFQNIHFLFYLQVWFQSNLNYFMKGLSLASLRIGSFFPMGTVSIWKCDVKSQIIYGGCSLYNQLLFPTMTFLCLILINLLLSKMTYFKKKQAISWGQIYCFWWVSSASFAVSSFFYAKQTSGDQFIIACVGIVLFLLASVALCFQVIKNVYNKSYAQKIFFWNIKRKAGQLANLHPLLLIVRRVCLIIGVAMASGSPLGCLFIATLLTIYIVSNMIINKSLKKMLEVQVAGEILFGILLVMLQMTIVNATKVSNSTWRVLGWINFTIMLVCIILFFIVVLDETISCLRKNVKKIRALIKGNEQDKNGEKQKSSKTISSNHSKNNKQSMENHHQPRESLSPKEGDDTQQEIMKCISSQSKHLRSSDGFSDMLSPTHAKTAAPKLIKLLKQPLPAQEQQQKLQ